MSANGDAPAETAAVRAQVLARLREDESFVLATHEHPDGDALGSLVAMHGLLSSLGKRSEMFIAPSDLPLPREYRMFPLDGLISEPPADIAQIGRGFGCEGVTVRTRDDLVQVSRWLDGPRDRPLVVDAKVTSGRGSWWLEEAFRGH